jgi:hypothetical protein
MQVSVRSEIFNPFWAQLFQNIGYSKVYNRYVIVEPLCYLTGNNTSFTDCISIDSIVYGSGSKIGNNVASFVDHERNDDIEQVLTPYIRNEKYRYILLTDHECILPKSRLPETLNHLRQNPRILKRVRGLVHYHIDEPNLSEADFNALSQFTGELKSMGGANQVGMILSDREPVDTLEAKKLGKKEFVKYLFSKLSKGTIDIVGELFTGKEGEHFPVEIRFDS